MKETWTGSSGGIILTVENQRTRRTICSGAILSTANAALTGLWWNPRFRVEWLATKALAMAWLQLCVEIRVCLQCWHYNACTVIRNTAKEEKAAQCSSLSFNSRWSIFGSTRNSYWKLNSGVPPNFLYFLHVNIGCTLTQSTRFPCMYFLISHSKLS